MTPRESAGFWMRFWPSRLALKYKGEVDCYEVEQGASLPLLQQLEVARGPYTPAHPVHPLCTRASPSIGDAPLHTLTHPFRSNASRGSKSSTRSTRRAWRASLRA